MMNVDEACLDKQRFLLEIVYGITNSLMFDNYNTLGSELITDTAMYTAFDDSMVKFTRQYEMGSILPRGEFFSAIQPYHAQQALGLFSFVYNAKDWDTFMRNVVWARLNVNEGMFVYTLNLAVIFRPDLKDLTLPPIYEILPQMFLNSKYILKAIQFNANFYNKQIMLEKKLGSVYKQNERLFMQDWKVWQWWKLMGLDQDWHLEEKTILRDNIEVVQNDPTFKAVWNDTKAYWMPVDYTRDIEIFNEETKLSYFTEDVGLNAYWYYLNMNTAYILNGTKYHMKNRGAFWTSNVQQLLARYHSERLSVGLGPIADMSFDGVVENGYNPQLIAYNGNGFTIRKNYQINSCPILLERLNTTERGIIDIIESGKYVTRDGRVIDITNSQSIGLIGDLLQGNVDIPDQQSFGYWYSLACLCSSGGDLDAPTVVPNVLQNFENMLNDPILYSILKKTVDLFAMYTRSLPPYTPKEVQMSTLNVSDAEISELRTHFDLVDIDVSTLLNDNMIFHDGNIKSEKPQRVVVRIFLSPGLDEFGKPVVNFINSLTIMVMDTFSFDLIPGENVIVRNSKDLANTVNDYATYTELYKYVMLAHNSEGEYPMEVAQRHRRFPHRLVLPRGWVHGMPMKMIFVVLPHTDCAGDPVTHEYCSGDGYIGNYPLDRKIEDINSFFGPNMLVKDVKIYHTEMYEKYYPNKYENFGSFDYTFKSVNLTQLEVKTSLGLPVI